jgi:hypothetical protein
VGDEAVLDAKARQEPPGRRLGDLAEVVVADRPGKAHAAQVDDQVSESAPEVQNYGPRSVDVGPEQKIQCREIRREELERVIDAV